nr:hypothetical protein [uncultured archaeon]
MNHEAFCFVKVRGKEESGFRSSIRSYRPERGVVFASAETEAIETNGTKIAYTPHHFI